MNTVDASSFAVFCAIMSASRNKRNPYAKKNSNNTESDDQKGCASRAASTQSACPEEQSLRSTQGALPAR
jgi:hypothetical protein